LLSVRDLTVSYGHVQAVQNLSFHVDERQTVTLLGANGAGKSSVIRAICGLERAARGSIFLDDRPITGLRPEQRVRLGIATVPEGRELFSSLTVEENLLVGAYLRRDRHAIRSDIDWIYSLFTSLRVKRRARAGTLSGGQGQMLAIGRALMALPRLLLMDEPSLGLAPLLVEEIFDLIPRLQAERSLALLLVEQNANKALSAASYGYVLETGVLALEGPSADLVRDPQIRALYLGG
jgi:branched-chain amino acid transport system ATP-binding protein